MLPLGVGDFMFSFPLFFSVLGYFCYIYLSIGIKKIFGDLFNCSTCIVDLCVEVANMALCLKKLSDRKSVV